MKNKQKNKAQDPEVIKKVKKERPKVAKYVINDQKTYEKLVKEAKNDNFVAVLGQRAEGFLVDVLWVKNIEESSSKWEEYKININSEGIHSFKSFPYLKNKL